MIIDYCLLRYKVKCVRVNNGGSLGNDNIIYAGRSKSETVQSSKHFSVQLRTCFPHFINHQPFRNIWPMIPSNIDANFSSILVYTSYSVDIITISQQIIELVAGRCPRAQ